MNVEFGDRFWSTVSEIGEQFDQNKLKNCIILFQHWKQFGGPMPNPPLKKDKSSAMDANEAFFKPYKLNNFWHCHCGLARNGDPLIMYRYIDKETIRLVCVTLHDYAFHKELRHHFVDEYSEEFPIKETIEYEDMTDYQKEIISAGNGPYIEAPVGITLDDKKYREWFDEQVDKAKKTHGTIIEYEDMTDYQKEIVDSGLRQPVGIVPPEVLLDNDKFHEWFMTNYNKAKNENI